MPFKDLPSAAFKIWEKVYNENKEKHGAEYAAKVAWTAVKNAGWQKVGEKWVKKSDYISELSMAFTAAPIDKQSLQMRWRATASDTVRDNYKERMSLPLYRSFIKHIENKEDVPPAFKDLIYSDSWQGGQPYVSLSHYPAFEDGFGIVGHGDIIYIDGNALKARGTFEDTDLGKACYKALAKDIANSERKIRVSIGFLDMAHRHGDNGKIFVRQSLDDRCPECDAGVGDKQYMDGYLIHYAMTRVPVNPRADMEVERSMTTRKEDALSVIGDEKLVDELEKRQAMIGKADLIVERSDEENWTDETQEAPVEEQAEGFVEGDPNAVLEETDDPNPVQPDEVIVAAADLEKARVAQKARSKKYGIAILAKNSNVTKPSKWADVPDSQWGDPVNYRYPMKNKAHASNAASRFGQEKASYRGKNIVGKRIERREKALGVEAAKEKSMAKDATSTAAPQTAQVVVDKTVAMPMDMPPKISDDDLSNLPYGGAVALQQVRKVGEQLPGDTNRVKSVFAMLQALAKNIYTRSDVTDKSMAIANLLSEAEQTVHELMDSLTAPHVAWKADVMEQSFKDLEAAVTQAKSQAGTTDEKLSVVVPVYEALCNKLVETIRSEVDPAPASPDPTNADTNALLLAEIRAMREEMAQLRSEAAINRAQTVAPAPTRKPLLGTPMVIPVPRSVSPTLVAKSQAKKTAFVTPDGKPKSKLSTMVRKSVGLTD